MRIRDIIEGDVVDLSAHKFKKAADSYVDALRGMFSSEREFFATGKFLPFAKTYIDHKLDLKYRPRIVLTVNFRDSSQLKERKPEANQFIRVLRSEGFKIVPESKLHKDFSRAGDMESALGPFGEKTLTVDEARAAFASRENSPYGVYQPSEAGFRASFKHLWDSRGIGFNITVEGYDSRRGDKYGNPMRHEAHVIDNDKDMAEVVEMYALINRAMIGAVPKEKPAPQGRSSVDKMRRPHKKDTGMHGV